MTQTLICNDLYPTKQDYTRKFIEILICDADPSANDQAMRGAVPVHPEPAKSPSHPSPGVKFAASQAELLNSVRFE